MTIEEILQRAIGSDAADIFLIAGLPVTFKCGGHQERMPEAFLKPDDIRALVDSVYALSHRDRRASTTTSPFRCRSSDAFVSTYFGSAARWRP